MTFGDGMSLLPLKAAISNQFPLEASSKTDEPLAT